MLSTLVLVGIMIGFGVAQVPYIKGRDLLGSTVTTQPQQVAAQPQQQAQQPAKNPTLTAEQIAKLPDDDAVMGDANAPITVVEFSDFQCPFCSRFWANTLSAIRTEYIQTGKVKFIYRDFPLKGHPEALPAALASECAHAQGKFEEMHELLFGGQSDWSQNPEASKVFKGYAKTLKLDQKAFDTCLDSKEPSAEIRKDLLDGVALGVDGTPAFFINGQFISGAMPYDTVFKPIFEAVLAGKNWELSADEFGEPKVTVK